MLKIMNCEDFLNTNAKCAEVFCQGQKQFSIICSFCNLKTIDYCDFLKHFQDAHKKCMDGLLEANQELPFDGIIGSGLQNDGNQKNQVESNIYTARENKGDDVFRNDNDRDVLSLEVDGLTKHDAENQTVLNIEFKEQDACKNFIPVGKKYKVHAKNRNELNEQLKCAICGIYKNNKYNLQSHINSHTGARPYNCQQCGNNFTNSGNLWKHIELVHKGIKTHQCSMCSKKFQYKCQAKRHEMRVHLRVRPFPCDKCESSYCTKRELQDHRTKHKTNYVLSVSPGETSTSLEIEENKCSKYICEHCGKSFAKYSGIWAHRRLHMGEKRYVCKVCSKPMHTSYHLKEHMNTHTGERPHKCELCGKAFQQKKFLRDHSRIHSDVKAFECKICGKKFSQAAGLYCHTKTHKEL